MRKLKNIEIIGENIRILRLKNGLSQEQLALLSNMNTSYIGQIERGEKNPTIRTLEKIANALKIDFIDLFVLSDPAAKSDNHPQSQQYLAILTPEDIKRYMLGILKDENNKP
ncbi:anaerobic benzoate catabolism transcriptional regulator [compost metagenome]